jgi:hypothetical protein
MTRASDHGHSQLMPLATAVRVDVDDELVAGQSLSSILGWYGLSKRAVDRHKGSHVRALLAQNDADLAAEFQATRQADYRQ